MLIVKGEIKNQHVSTLCSVSRVEVSPDNAFAIVYISSVMDENTLNKSVEALQGASGFIQKRVGAFLKTRNTPVLHFKADTSLREGQKLNALIDSLVDNGK